MRVFPQLFACCQRARSRDPRCRRAQSATFGSAALALMRGRRMLLTIKPSSYFDLDRISTHVTGQMDRLQGLPLRLAWQELPPGLSGGRAGGLRKSACPLITEKSGDQRRSRVVLGTDRTAPFLSSECSRRFCPLATPRGGKTWKFGAVDFCIWPLALLRCHPCHASP